MHSTCASGGANMIICSPISTSAKNVVYLSACVQSEMGSNICAAVSRRPSGSCSFYLYPGPSKTSCGSSSVSKTVSSPSFTGQTIQGSCFRSCFSSQRGNLQVKCVGSAKGPQRKHLDISLACQNLNMRLLVPKQGMLPRIKCNVGPVSWPQGCASAGLIFGLLVCYSSSEPAHAEAAREKGDKEDDCDLSHVKFSHGKKVYTNYSVIGEHQFFAQLIYVSLFCQYYRQFLVHQTLHLKLLVYIVLLQLDVSVQITAQFSPGIPGDGRCLFRSVAHGACVQSGKPAPSESLQRELADDLRARVCVLCSFTMMTIGLNFSFLYFYYFKPKKHSLLQSGCSDCIDFINSPHIYSLLRRCAFCLFSFCKKI